MINDKLFSFADDVTSIRYRLHPLDVGFDLRGEQIRIEIERSADPLRVSYAGEDGERRVMVGPHAEVVAELRDLGYRICEVIRYRAADGVWGYREGDIIECIDTGERCRVVHTGAGIQLEAVRS